LRGRGRLGGNATISCALWVIDHQEAWQRIGSSADAAAEVFERWLGTAEPLQAWIARAAWIPEFDTYEDFMPTLYERTLAPEWRQADRAAPAPRLRYVAPKLWLDESFMGALDARQLEAVAEPSRRGRVTALSLRAGRSPAELEAALAPILPRLYDGHMPRG
jgi:hypothetical protein